MTRYFLESYADGHGGFTLELHSDLTTAASRVAQSGIGGLTRIVQELIGTVGNVLVQPPLSLSDVASVPTQKDVQLAQAVADRAAALRQAADKDTQLATKDAQLASVTAQLRAAQEVIAVQAAEIAAP
jgi:hypothetical protein